MNKDEVLEQMYSLQQKINATLDEIDECTKRIRVADESNTILLSQLNRMLDERLDLENRVEAYRKHYARLANQL